MFRNYVAAAWRSARRDRFYALLNVLGLGMGFAAAILIGLYVRDELSYDRFLPGYQDVYRLQLTFGMSGQRPSTSPRVPALLAQEIALDFPEIALAVRVAPQNVGLRHGEVEATEAIETADPEFFAVLGFPLLRGDPATALAEPDTIVLTRRLAEKYFGTIDCVGQTLDLDRVHAVRVSGIAEDPPTNTTNGFSALLSSKSQYSAITLAPQQKGAFLVTVSTFLRLKTGVAPASLAARLPGFVAAHYPDPASQIPQFTIFLRPLADLHLHPYNPDTAEGDSRAETVYAVAAVGLLILLLAGINFVNLVTARATRRAVEVGVRKALGGMHHQLMTQFMGESVAYALVGLVIGAALAELCLPSLNGFLDRQIAFDFWRDPLLLMLPIATAVLLGLIAGIYPAVVLSSVSPATALKSRTGGPIGGGRLRLALVVFQFTVTIALLISATVIYRQNVFAATQALHFDKDLVLTVDLAGLPHRPSPDGLRRVEEASLDALRTQFVAVPGVRNVASSFSVPAAQGHLLLGFHRRDQTDRPDSTLSLLPVDFGFFDVYGLHLNSGRDFSRDHTEDVVTNDPAKTASAIINESTVHTLGFTDATAAIGQEIVAGDSGFRIIGVIPDFPLDSIRQPVSPSIFFVEPDLFFVISLKLSGADLPATLRGIDAAWHDVAPGSPINRSFVDDRIARLYLDEAREGRLFAAFAGFAAVIGCLGLVGLSAYTAERRTKEIGIRKALGASTSAVVRMLIWQFTRPVLIANALAWPIAWWFMRGWLDGFAYRIDLGALPFLAAGLASLAIAIATTAFHAVQVARSRPVLALRYE